MENIQRKPIYLYIMKKSLSIATFSLCVRKLKNIPTCHLLTDLLLYSNSKSNKYVEENLGGLYSAVTVSSAHWKVIFSGGLGLTEEDKNQHKQLTRYLQVGSF